MPTEIVVQSSLDGGSVTLQPVDATGNFFRNDGQTVLKVLGPAATEWTVVVANGHDCSFGEHPDYLIVCPIGKTTIESSRFAAKRFNDPGGLVQLTYTPSAVGISIAAVSYGINFKD